MVITGGSSKDRRKTSAWGALGTRNNNATMSEDKLLYEFNSHKADSTKNQTIKINIEKKITAYLY